METSDSCQGESICPPPTLEMSRMHMNLFCISSVCLPVYPRPVSLVVLVINPSPKTCNLIRVEEETS